MFYLYLQAEIELTKMTYYEPSEWDESKEQLEKWEESEAENVLRSERDIVLSRLNHGIQYENLELNNII